jgi:hypothetical protein
VQRTAILATARASTRGGSLDGIDAIGNLRGPARMAACVLACLCAVACSRRAPDPSAGANPNPTRNPESGAPVTFVNRVWKVAESTGMSPGQLVVFLSDGTLVFASPFEKPALGTWRRNGDTLTMVEEGIPYRTDILSLSSREFRIRSHNPGGFVETRFVPAEESP